MTRPTIIDVKAEVQPGNMVKFAYYRDSQLWYKTQSGVLFPVPVEDIGNATFNAEDKAILFMRYMRKFNQNTSSQTEGLGFDKDGPRGTIKASGPGFGWKLSEEAKRDIAEIERNMIFLTSHKGE